MKLRFLAGMFAVLFSGQAVAIDNVTDEAIEHCSEMHTLAVNLYNLANRKDGSALKIFTLSEGDRDLQSLTMAAMQASNVSDRFGGPTETGIKFSADVLKICLANFHDKEFIGAYISQYGVMEYPIDEHDPKYLKLKKAYEESKKQK